MPIKMEQKFKNNIASYTTYLFDLKNESDKQKVIEFMKEWLETHSNQNDSTDSFQPLVQLEIINIGLIEQDKEYKDIFQKYFKEIRSRKYNIAINAYEMEKQKVEYLLSSALQNFTK